LKNSKSLYPFLAELTTPLNFGKKCLKATEFAQAGCRDTLKIGNVYLT